MLLSDWARMAAVVDHIVEHAARIHVALVRVEQLAEKELKFARHLHTDTHSLRLPLILGILGRRCLPFDSCLEYLVAHIGQEEECLDKRVEVAGVANILQTHGQLLLSHATVKGERLGLQTRLDGRIDVRICHA